MDHQTKIALSASDVVRFQMAVLFTSVFTDSLSVCVGCNINGGAALSCTTSKRMNTPWFVSSHRPTVHAHTLYARRLTSSHIRTAYGCDPSLVFESTTSLTFLVNVEHSDIS
ncbi:hypothetical protein F2P81_020994 [Scophthalmus maximus]|uniref:Uncharacterized protein n=1 Tax=Scophthalmus maximus TaxID=52904 RepID=A0A6A4S014_SCOMX|nr:hypothetical protein F2P81_020994 [Scophthalmus maximus]